MTPRNSNLYRGEWANVIDVNFEEVVEGMSPAQFFELYLKGRRRELGEESSWL